jgi:hypothetical protein
MCHIAKPWDSHVPYFQAQPSQAQVNKCQEINERDTATFGTKLGFIRYQHFSILGYVYLKTLL